MEKFAVATGLVLAALTMPGLSAPVAAQDAVRYVGELTGCGFAQF